MTRDATIRRFCVLSETVMTSKFKCTESADCFCGDKPHNPEHFRFSEDVMRFIESAVEEKLKSK